MVEQLIVDGSISASDMNVFSGINVLFGSEDIGLALYGDNGRRVGRVGGESPHDTKENQPLRAASP
jgi:hypothetical protein